MDRDRSSLALRTDYFPLFLERLVVSCQCLSDGRGTEEGVITNVWSDLLIELTTARGDLSEKVGNSRTVLRSMIAASG